MNLALGGVGVLLAAVVIVGLVAPLTDPPGLVRADPRHAQGHRPLRDAVRAEIS